MSRLIFVVVKGVELYVECDYSPADHETGWGEEVEVCSVCTGEMGGGNYSADILPLLALPMVQLIEVEIKEALAQERRNERLEAAGL